MSSLSDKFHRIGQNARAQFNNVEDTFNKNPKTFLAFFQNMAVIGGMTAVGFFMLRATYPLLDKFVADNLRFNIATGGFDNRPDPNDV